jgi:hypothetical protein
VVVVVGCDGGGGGLRDGPGERQLKVRFNGSIELASALEAWEFRAAPADFRSLVLATKDKGWSVSDESVLAPWQSCGSLLLFESSRLIFYFRTREERVAKLETRTRQTEHHSAQRFTSPTRRHQQTFFQLSIPNTVSINQQTWPRHQDQECPRWQSNQPPRPCLPVS